MTLFGTILIFFFGFIVGGGFVYLLQGYIRREVYKRSLKFLINGIKEEGRLLDAGICPFCLNRFEQGSDLVEGLEKKGGINSSPLRKKPDFNPPSINKREGEMFD